MPGHHWFALNLIPFEMSTPISHPPQSQSQSPSPSIASSQSSLKMELNKSPVTINEGVYYKDKVDDYERRRESMSSVHGGDGLLGASPASSFLINPLMGKKDLGVNNNNPPLLLRPNNNKVVALNPDAQEWHPENDSAPEEQRCLFLTFSNGYPLSHAQIIKFFTRMYGTCVERVYVHNPKSKKTPPLFGKVVFYSSLIPGLVMGSEERVKFTVDQRTLWCKRFQPRITRDDYDNANA